MGLWSNLSPEDETLAESCTPYGECTPYGKYSEYGEPVQDPDCTCHLLPTHDMDGSRYTGLCPSCEKARTEAGYDRYSNAGRHARRGN